jgi:hypothetical protein
MKVLLVGEGKHEAGGALEALVRRLSKHQAMRLEFKKISDPELHVHHGKGHGVFKRSLAWMRRAQRDGYAAIVILIDHDGYDDRILATDQAQNDLQHATVPRALGVAIRSFDAWILADEQALTRTLGCPPIQRQPAPETIDDPKALCDQLCCDAGRPMALSDMYKAVLEAANLELLVERCPRGFAPFAKHVGSI